MTASAPATGFLRSIGRFSLMALLVQPCRSFLPPHHRREAFRPRTASSPTASSSSSSSPSLPRLAASVDDESFPETCVSFIEPETGCEVTLVGCIHGTATSASDVRQMITPDTKIVAMELCASRFEVVKSMGRKKRQAAEAALADPGIDAEVTMDSDNAPHDGQEGPVHWFMEQLNFVADKIQSRGLGAGLATAAIASVGDLQTKLGGTVQGLEFLAATEAAQECDDCDVFCIDVWVDTTLKRISEIPQVSMAMWGLGDPAVYFGSDSLASNPDGVALSEQRKSDIMSALRIFAGDDSLSSSKVHNNATEAVPQTPLLRALTRKGVRLDTARLLLPFFLATTVFSYVFQGLFTGLCALAGLIDTSTLDFIYWIPYGWIFSGISVSQPTVSLIGNIIFNVVTSTIRVAVLLAPLVPIVVLPWAKVVLFERDEIMAQRLRKICKYVVSRDGSPGRIVGVMGLMHVNGVAYHMLSPPGSASTNPEDASSVAVETEDADVGVDESPGIFNATAQSSSSSSSLSVFE